MRDPDGAATARLASPPDQVRPHYAAVVVGSGYGGGIAASRLARAGQTVCLLERGRELQPGEYPSTAAEAAREFQVSGPDGHAGSATGLYDLHLNEGMSVFVGCGLGGTSLLNAGVALRAEPRVFDDPCWPRPLRGSPGLLDPHYARAEEMLKPVAYPAGQPRLAKLSALEVSAGRLGGRFYRPPINVTFEDGVNHVGVLQNGCRLCGDCVSGCNHRAKNTVLMNYLPDARNHGAEIFVECQVGWLERVDGRWVVHYQLLGSGRAAFAAPDLFVTADVVVLAAGTLGSTEILLRSRSRGLALSEHLGHHFSANGDVLAFGYNSEREVDGVGYGHEPAGGRPPVGPCITGIVDLREQPELRHGMVIEEGAIPGALANELPAAFAAIAGTGVNTVSGFRALLRQREREVESLLLSPRGGAVGNTQTYLVMTHDSAGGRIRLEADRAVVEWTRAGDAEILELVDRRLLRATEAIGGIHVRDPIWSRLTGESLITVHPLGGCVMAEDAAGGVVDGCHRVFAATAGTAVHEGLYVMDGSVVPRPLGVNPLLTISALAERAVAGLAEERGWTIDYRLPSAPSAPPVPVTVGVEFTERMSGFLSTDLTGGYEDAAERGRREGSTLTFTLTIAAADLERMLRDPEHPARMAGTMEAPSLAAGPLAVADGAFNLFVDDPATPGAKRMWYRARLASEAGAEFHFEGYKLIEGNRWTELWRQTTTLYVTVRRGADPAGPVHARGVLTIAPEDFARQLTTMQCTGAAGEAQRLEALARFGLAFAGTLIHTYGGVQVPAAGSGSALRKKRGLRLPAPEVHPLLPAGGAAILLTRHPGGDRGPVLLVPDASQSSRLFTVDTVPASLAEYLAASGFEVWLLDHRGSLGLPQGDGYSLDGLAADVRAAAETVRAATGAQGLPLVGHGLGATVSLMAVLGGLDGVGAMVCSQEGLHFPAPVTAPAVTAAGLSGPLPGRCLEQLRRMHEAGHAVDEHGADVYLPGVARLGFPIAFLVGARDPRDRAAGSRATFEWLRAAHGRDLYTRQVARGFGYDDCLAGPGAARAIYPWLLGQLERA